MPDVQFRVIETNGIRMRVAEKGSGPLVVMCHGFPESWYSWRHQLDSLAAAGFHAVAPDMRGYGETDAPDAIDQYSLLHLVGDMVDLVHALGADTAVIAGHDWGAPVAWHAALLRPDLFRAVIGLSVPYRPRGAARPVFPRTEHAVFYQGYFQEPGVAEADLEADIRATMRDTLLRLSGDVPPVAGSDGFSMVPLPGGLRSRMAEFAAVPLPGWLTEADLDFYANAFRARGFRGGLSWYRNILRNWELMAPFAGARITVPALYVAGERDLVLRFPGAMDLVANLTRWVPRLTRTAILPDCGHWTQQERSDEVNAAVLSFLRAL